MARRTRDRGGVPAAPFRARTQESMQGRFGERGGAQLQATLRSARNALLSAPGQFLSKALTPTWQPYTPLVPSGQATGAWGTEIGYWSLGDERSAGLVIDLDR